MAINKDEIDKYIFDPENPKQCKSYNLLLRIVKKEDFKSFFSPEFLHYFFQDQILTKEFDEAIWDKPDDYSSLNITKKIQLYKKNLSKDELIDYGKTLKIHVKVWRQKNADEKGEFKTYTDSIIDFSESNPFGEP